MERLHRPINSFLQFLECMEAEAFSGRSSAHEAVNGENQSTPFLEMLQEEMRRAGEPLEPGFQLLRLQEQSSRGKRAAPEVESCVTLSSDAATTAPPMHPVERKKRKRASTAAAKSRGTVRPEAESQRMTHIVVERNRRRLMNEHLAALRSLMPSSFVQRGDQASIIGGAIEFVKELEQMLLSLRAEKSSREAVVMGEDEEEMSAAAAASGFFISPQYRGYSQGRWRGGEEGESGVDVEATVVQGHVNLKVAGRRRMGQIVRAIAAMEELRLTVLHLSITSLDAASILYSLNLKMEEDCNLGSADEIATAVHQIFSFINAC